MTGHARPVVMTRARRVVVCAALSIPGLAAACSGADAPDPAGPEVVRETHGDTTVVRTLSGSEWAAPATLEPEVSIGELDGPDHLLFGRIRALGVGPEGTIYAMDGQVPDLRAFRPDGSYIGTLAGPGEGPGELKGPDGGLAVLSDGRILVRDPGNGRIQVLSPEGQALDTWPLRGGFNTGAPLYVDRQDRSYTQLLVDPTADVRDWVIGLVRIDPDGTVGDTLVPPDVDYEAPSIESRRENSVSRNSVPFSASEFTTFHPDGFWVHGLSTQYAFTLYRPEGPLRIERVVEPVPVAGGEKREEEAAATRNMRSNDPNWRWNGPAIPDHKPAYRGLHAGRDGRVWVVKSMAGVQGKDPDYDPADPDAVADEWTEPLAFDVFEEDGTYLGEVRAPEGMARYPYPVFDGNAVWAVVQDELGVNRIVRYRLTLPDTSD